MDELAQIGKKARTTKEEGRRSEMSDIELCFYDALVEPNGSPPKIMDGKATTKTQVEEALIDLSLK